MDRKGNICEITPGPDVNVLQLVQVVQWQVINFKAGQYRLQTGISEVITPYT